MFQQTGAPGQINLSVFSRFKFAENVLILGSKIQTYFAIQLKSGKLILSGSEPTNNSIVFLGTLSTVCRIKLSLLITIAMLSAAPYSPMFKFLSTF